MTDKETDVPKVEKVTPEKRVELQAAFNTGLANFRSQVKAPAKNGHVNYGTKNGNNKKYDYVLLDDLIKSIDDGLKATGLAWYQEAEIDMKVIRVRTIIVHTTGFVYHSPWMKFTTNGQPQEAGSAITYAKRYSLGASFGVSSEVDDDGAATSAPAASPSIAQHSGGQRQQRGGVNQRRQNNNQTNTSSGPLKQAMHQIELISQATGRDQPDIYQELMGQTGYVDAELNTTSNAVKFFNAAKQMRHDLEGGNV